MTFSGDHRDEAGTEEKRYPFVRSADPVLL